MHSVSTVVLVVLLVHMSAGCGGSSALGPGSQEAATGDAPAAAPDGPPARDAGPVFTFPDVPAACSIRLGLQQSPPARPDLVIPPDRLRGNPRNLTPMQLATRLTRFLWAAAPEPSLVDKIAACPPQYAEQVADLARQMLADPRARKGVEAFFTWWLNLEDVNRFKLTPGIPPGLLDAIAAEPARFGAHVVFDGGGKFGTLLTAPYSIINESLARLYGVAGVSGPDFTKAALDETQRIGLWTQAGILLQNGDGDADTYPTGRAVFIRSRILCQDIPEHPPAVDPEPQPAGQTKREWLTAVASHEVCVPCHGGLDPMGLAFEHYDGLGRYRANDRGRPIDTSGKLITWEPEVSFTGLRDLIGQLSRSELPARCFSSKVLEFASGRPFRFDEDAAREELARRFLQEGGDIRWLLTFVTTTVPFLTP
jgi:hypothetical protein